MDLAQMTLSHNTPPPTITTQSTTAQGGAASLTALHSDIIESHILPRLDGATLASVSCCSKSLHHLSSKDHLWDNICRATWPSTASQRVRQVISNCGPRAFFAQSYSLSPPPEPTTPSNNPRRSSPPPSELISAVDIRFKDELIFTKIQETETVTGWFRCSPFRIDLLEPKDVVPTTITHPDGDEACTSLMEDMSLSWILIDPIRQTAVNISSQKPVSVQRHWLTGEVQVKFATVHKAPTWGQVQCGIVVTCAGSAGGEVQVKEVSLEVEDMDGAHLKGKDSLIILQRGLEDKRGKGKCRAEEGTGRRRYQQFLEMKRRREERKLRREEALDILSVAFGVSVFVAFWCVLLFR